MVTALVHFDTAKRELVLATNIDEIKLIRDKAEALRQYIKQQKGSFEMQNQAAEIKLRAERRAGEMLKEMEKNPGVKMDGSKPGFIGGNIMQPPIDAPTLSDLGISKIQSHRWQLEAKVPEEQFEQYVTETKATGEELTSVGLRQLAAQKPHVFNNSGNNEWYTPQVYIEAAREVMGSIDTDPASSDIANKIVKATTYFAIQDDGRMKQWVGNIWLNPPYAQPFVAEFCELLVEKYKDKEIQQACVLVNNATETMFYQNMLNACSAVCFIKGRVKFIDENGVESGAPLQGQTVLYFGLNKDKFSQYFSQFGVILYAI